LFPVVPPSIATNAECIVRCQTAAEATTADAAAETSATVHLLTQRKSTAGPHLNYFLITAATSAAVVAAAMQ